MTLWISNLSEKKKTSFFVTNWDGVNTIIPNSWALPRIWSIFVRGVFTICLYDRQRFSSIAKVFYMCKTKSHSVTCCKRLSDFLLSFPISLDIFLLNLILSSVIHYTDFINKTWHPFYELWKNTNVYPTFNISERLK